jgi:hypothetical protein
MYEIEPQCEQQRRVFYIGLALVASFDTLAGCEGLSALCLP